MLYRYSVENYKSFKTKAELAMFPFAQEGLEGKELEDDTNIPILKTAVIFGANASGKSNLIKSIAFARLLILGYENLTSVNNPCFKLDDESIYKPTIFNFEIKVGEQLLQYGFSILFSKNRIEEEWLYDLRKNAQIFLRVYQEEQNNYQFSYDGIHFSQDEQSRLTVYEEDIRQNYSRLMLTELAGKKSSDSEFWKIIRNTFHWFKDMRILFPGSKYNLLIQVARNEQKINEIYKEYFRLFDINIDTIHLNNIPLEMLRLDSDSITEMKNDLLKASEENDAFIMINLKGHEYLLDMNEEGDLLAKEVKFRHLKNDGQHTYDFDKSEESDGTKRLFDLIPALARIISGDDVFIIDEIDRSLHSLLTYKILQTFKIKSKGKKSQLICTTHEQLLLDGGLFRPDELWMVNMDKTTSQSDLYSLAEYKVKFWENIEKNYLLGRYKAIPNFNGLR